MLAAYSAAGLSGAAWLKVFDYREDMPRLYTAADLVISRSGASAIYELMFFEKPAILIPYPFASAHQLKNAQVLEKIGAAYIVNDSELDYGVLKDTLKGLFTDLVACYSNYSRHDAVFCAICAADEKD